MAHASQRKSTKNGIFSGYLLAPIAVQLTWVASTHIKRQAKERKTCQNPTAICFKTKQERNKAAPKRTAAYRLLMGLLRGGVRLERGRNYRYSVSTNRN
jgi:hypothetical protein